MIMELLLNDREMFKQETSLDLETEKITAQFNESEPPKSYSEKYIPLETRKEESSAQNTDIVHQYKSKLESLCEMYQQKLEEISQFKQQPLAPNPNEEMMTAWQNMQMMNAQLSNQMKQLTQIQSQMTSHMQQVQGLVVPHPDLNQPLNPHPATQFYTGPFGSSPLMLTSQTTYLPSPSAGQVQQFHHVGVRVDSQANSKQVSSHHSVCGHYPTIKTQHAAANDAEEYESSSRLKQGTNMSKTDQSQQPVAAAPSQREQETS